jgi:hypothetical protein
LIQIGTLPAGAALATPAEKSKAEADLAKFEGLNPES